MIGKGREDVCCSSCLWESREIDGTGVGRLDCASIREIDADGVDRWF